MTQIRTTLLLLIFGLTLFGQNISVDTLFLPKTESLTHFQSDKLKFPIIKTGDLKIDNLINKDLKNRFTHNAFTNYPTDSTIIKWSNEQIIYLDFEVTYVKNGLISLNISTEGCGAYCTAWTDYFTYNYRTGQFLTIDQIIDTTGNFKTLVLSDKDKLYEQQKKELKEMLLDKNEKLDEDTYKWALEHYENCDKEFTLESFALHSDHLEIIEKCSLPNAIKNLTPTIVLKYKYVAIKNALKIIN
jgi:hypothetical protein